MPVSGSTLAFVASVLLVAFVVLYRAALPKPIPGIPYHKPSASKILGDVPDALKWSNETSEISGFLRARCEELNSPVVQIFLRPLGKPSVIVADAREAHDIMARRAKEFDRAAFLTNLFRASFPNHQVVMRTTDQWRYNRRLVADTMTPQFLNTVASPQVHAATLDLIELWRQKMRLAQGRAFDVQKDMQNCTVDTICAAAFGVNIGTSKTQSTFLSGQASISKPADVDDLIVIPTTKAPDEYTAIVTLAMSSEIALHSVFGWLHHWVALRVVPRFRRAVAVKNRLVTDQIQRAWKTFSSDAGEKQDNAIKCAVDLVVEREVALARKEKRAPLHDSIYVKDELAGFLNAGFETTSTSISWGLKFLTAHQDVQTKLRAILRDEFPDAYAMGTPPDAEALAKSSIPYLEAFIEEALRVGAIVPAGTRVATVDTQILGYPIPKGVDIMMLNNGPSIQSSPMFIDENRRSQTGRDDKASTEQWNQADLDVFNPDRWLVKKDDGTIKFDIRAAPQQIFGEGPRACFGRRLAYLEMREIYSLIVWNFELLPIPQHLVDFKGNDEVTHHAQNVRIRLAEAR